MQKMGIAGNVIVWFFKSVWKVCGKYFFQHTDTIPDSDNLRPTYFKTFLGISSCSDTNILNIRNFNFS